MGKSDDSDDFDLDGLLSDELNLDSIGYSVDEEKVKHAIWKDGFVARWAMILLLTVTGVCVVVIFCNRAIEPANETSRWAMELVKTIAVAFVGFLAGGVSASKGA